MTKGTKVYVLGREKPFHVTEGPEEVLRRMGRVRSDFFRAEQLLEVFADEAQETGGPEQIAMDMDRMIWLRLEEIDDGTPPLDFFVAVDHIVVVEEWR